jgi:hypothetical protein
MNALNFQASVSHLTQMDRFQQDTHRTPIVNQDQNSQIARDEALKKANITTQPDEIERKKIDPRQRKEDTTRQRRNKKKESNIASSAKVMDNGTNLDICV